MDLNNYVLDLQKLIKYNSIQGEKREGAPFGKEVNDCLLTFLEIASSFGFKTINYDGFAGEVIFGEGKKELGVLCHLDIVPVGCLSDWKTPPFKLVNDGEKLIGRGVLDDKGPALTILYALKSLKDEGFIPKNKIRLILGCNEESGWGCINHLKSLNKMPDFGFSPDAEFPVIYAEKGIIHLEFTFDCQNVLSIDGGKATNMVCDYVECKVGPFNEQKAKSFGLEVSNGTLISHGKTAHASTPHKGENAMLPMLKFLAENKNVAQEVVDKLFFNSTKIKNLCDETGYLTLSPNQISLKEDKLSILCDIRYPSTISYENILKEIAKIAPYTILSHQPSLFVDKNSPLVKTLSQVYKQITGNNSQPIAIGGGTYARSMPCCVAFGPVIMQEDSVCHEPNEYIKIENLILSYEIYKKALKVL